MPRATIPLRKGPSGPRDTSGGGSFDPIQQVRFLDPDYAGGDSNGSIAKPYTTLTPFFTEATSGSNGWELELPGSSLTVGTVPDFVTSPDVKLSGMDRDSTVLDAVILPAQTAAPSLQLSDLSITGALQFETGGTNLKAESCTIGSVVTVGTLTGSVELTNVDITGNADFSNRDVSWHSGSFTGGGTLTFRNATFENVSFGDNATLIPGIGISRFVSCLFGSGITISNAFVPVLYFDPYTFDSLIQNNVTYVGARLMIPSMPYLGRVSKTTPGSVGANDTEIIDFGNPTSAPTAEPLSPILGTFAEYPGGAAGAISIVDMNVGETGSIFATIANASAAPVVLTDPLIINIMYVPR